MWADLYNSSAYKKNNYYSMIHMYANDKHKVANNRMASPCLKLHNTRTIFIVLTLPFRIV